MASPCQLPLLRWLVLFTWWSRATGKSLLMVLFFSNISCPSLFDLFFPLSFTPLLGLSTCKFSLQRRPSLGSAFRWQLEPPWEKLSEGFLQTNERKVCHWLNYSTISLWCTIHFTYPLERIAWLQPCSEGTNTHLLRRGEIMAVCFESIWEQNVLSVRAETVDPVPSFAKRITISTVWAFVWRHLNSVYSKQLLWQEHPFRYKIGSKIL